MSSTSAGVSPSARGRFGRPCGPSCRAATAVAPLKSNRSVKAITAMSDFVMVLIRSGPDPLHLFFNQPYELGTLRRRQIAHHPFGGAGAVRDTDRLRVLPI